MANNNGDMDKLQTAFSELARMFGSVDELLETFGLAHMPTAQRYGILVGFVVFICTVTAVITLLVMGGSIQRIAEQAETGSSTVQEGYKARMGRALLFERLLEARQRMLKDNYAKSEQPKDVPELTNLTRMLLNVVPPSKSKKKKTDSSAAAAYQQNYASAYRKCQDKPGGAILTGRPEARFEAYSRAFAGCGDATDASYRRSYARVYESLACDSHKTDDMFNKMFESTPEAIVGKSVRLEGLNVKDHLQDIFTATSGGVFHETKSYDAHKVWGFMEDGPFKSAEAMAKSRLFQRLSNEAAFCIRQNLTNRVIGAVVLKHDSPSNLSIQMEAPMLHPNFWESKEQFETCFLLLDRLFAHGYRRIQMSVDVNDTDGAKLAGRLGFTFEGCLIKHMIVKDSSRDSNVHGMLNNDWKNGARLAMYKKLYGASAARADVNNNNKEEEIDGQTQGLAEQKAEEAKKKQ
mmetsp:Transcript_21313/g.59235  ORF Transcript_21313/g.59235 Transcript_21313/m.59235 type:complete len:463 (-) Transcript_21313:1635-3023(-)|eukprot:CAMPEP_0198114950 /NCGR_PEP_ID=MMETSP1442-20131203/6183_1 /TAXON_ID= /ORGANISM="Craspedostauros australis, Strain CCMP3328" /LENGTH=462 /DNA_ID=CAMNT_0043772361 /DNA_START=124 /DNA_END=1512 /DNA_ORIENTATION=-